ncbi:MAG: Mrp/NBP35 family ATP-binding protein [Erysipelotrichaceae bacterium]
MSTNCSHKCESCKENCSERSFIVQPLESTHIKKIIGVVSGKGGVGKSVTTSLLASLVVKSGFTSAILDADITGPSIPKMLGINHKAVGDGNAIFPNVTKTGIKVMSINLLIQDEGQPVVWRGPILAGTVKQFYQEVLWEDVDFMFVDMPPGTSDVPLTVYQSLPIDGIVIVTSPSDLVNMIVDKAINMANMMNIPILGVVENYSYLQCPNCEERINVFGESHIKEILADKGLNLLAQIPIDPAISKACDQGLIEEYNSKELEAVKGVFFDLLKED